MSTLKLIKDLSEKYLQRGIVVDPSDGERFALSPDPTTSTYFFEHMLLRAAGINDFQGNCMTVIDDDNLILEITGLAPEAIKNLKDFCGDNTECNTTFIIEPARFEQEIYPAIESTAEKLSQTEPKALLPYVATSYLAFALIMQTLALDEALYDEKCIAMNLDLFKVTYANAIREATMHFYKESDTEESMHTTDTVKNFCKRTLAEYAGIVKDLHALSDLVKKNYNLSANSDANKYIANINIALKLLPLKAKQEVLRSTQSESNLYNGQSNLFRPDSESTNGPTKVLPRSLSM